MSSVVIVEKRKTYFLCSLSFFSAVCWLFLLTVTKPEYLEHFPPFLAYFTNSKTTVHLHFSLTDPQIWAGESTRKRCTWATAQVWETKQSFNSLEEATKTLNGEVLKMGKTCWFYTIRYFPLHFQVSTLLPANVHFFYQILPHHKYVSLLMIQVTKYTKFKLEILCFRHQLII